MAKLYKGSMFCHHGDTICHPKSGYVMNKLHVSFTMREMDDLGLPNNDSRLHKRFGYASRRSTIHIPSTREKTHLFGTTITSGRPNSLASLTISFFVKRNITWHWSSVNACTLNRGHARSYVTPLGIGSVADISGRYRHFRWQAAIAVDDLPPY